MASDRYGKGDLLAKGSHRFARDASKSDATYEPLRPIRSGQFGPPQALFYSIRFMDGKRFDVPLAAKESTFNRGGRPWFSISSLVKEKATSNVILTYVDTEGVIFVGDRRNATQDPGDFRFFELYYGWFVSDLITLPVWLKFPHIPVQTSLNEAGK